MKQHKTVLSRLTEVAALYFIIEEKARGHQRLPPHLPVAVPGLTPNTLRWRRGPLFPPLRHPPLQAATTIIRMQLCALGLLTAIRPFNLSLPGSFIFIFPNPLYVEGDVGQEQPIRLPAAGESPPSSNRHGCLGVINQLSTVTWAL